jgi:hypothetical protein
MSKSDLRLWPPARLIEIVTVGLGEPPDVPVACTQVLVLGYRGLIQQFKSCAALDRRELCTKTMRFLTAPRTTEDLVSLQSSMATGPSPCRCAQGPRVLHNLPHHAVDPIDANASLQDLIVWMPMLLTMEFAFGKGTPTPRQIKTRPTWPASRLELLPEDPAASCHMLSLWVLLLQQGTEYAITMIALIRDVFLAARTYTLVGWMQTPLLWSLIHGVATRYKLRATPASIRGAGDDPSVAELLTVMNIVQLLEMEMFDEELEISVTTHPSLSAHDILGALCKGAQAVDNVDAESLALLERLRSDWKRLLARLVVRLPAATPPNLPRSVREIVSRLRLEHNRPAERLYDSAFAEAWAHRCYGPSCLSSHLSPGANFKLCADCGVAAYCSRSCQKAAWRYSGAAHRDICIIYRAYYPTSKTRQYKIIKARWKQQVSKEAAGVGHDLSFLHHFSAETLDAAYLNVWYLRRTKLAALSMSVEPCKSSIFLTFYQSKDCKTIP